MFLKYLWADNCISQNKNRIILMAMIYLVAKYINSIELKFLVSGHSFVACETDFGLIEKIRLILVSDINKLIVSARL